MTCFRSRKGLVTFVLWAYVHCLFATAFASQSEEYQAFLRDNPKELIQGQTGKPYRPVVAYGLKKFIEYEKSPTEEGEEALLNLLTYGDGVGGMCQDPHLSLNSDEEALYRAIYAQILLNRDQRGQYTLVAPREGRSNLALFYDTQLTVWRREGFFNSSKKGFLEGAASLLEDPKVRREALALTDSETGSETKPSTNEVIEEDSAEELFEQEESFLDVSRSQGEKQEETPSFWKLAQERVEEALEQQRLYQALTKPPLPESGRRFGGRVQRGTNINSVNRQPRSFAFPSLGLSLQSLVLKLNTGFKTQDLTVYELPQADVVFDFLGHYHGLGLLKVKSFTMKAGGGTDIGHPYHPFGSAAHWHEKNGGGIESETFIHIFTQKALTCYFGTLKSQQGLTQLISPESVTLWASTISNPNGTGIMVRSPKVAIEMSSCVNDWKAFGYSKHFDDRGGWHDVSAPSLLETNGFVSFQPYETALKVTNHGGTIKGLQGIFVDRRPLRNDENKVVLIHEPLHNPRGYAMKNSGDDAGTWYPIYGSAGGQRAVLISDVPVQITTGELIGIGVDLLGKTGADLYAKLKMVLESTRILAPKGSIKLHSGGDLLTQAVTMIADELIDLYAKGKRNNTIATFINHFVDGNKKIWQERLGERSLFLAQEIKDLSEGDFRSEVPIYQALKKLVWGSLQGDALLLSKITTTLEEEIIKKKSFFSSSTTTKRNTTRQCAVPLTEAPLIEQHGKNILNQGNTKAKKVINHGEKTFTQASNKVGQHSYVNQETKTPLCSTRQGIESYQEVLVPSRFEVEELESTCNQCALTFLDIIKPKEFKSNLPIKERALELIAWSHSWNEVNRVLPEGTEIVVAMAAAYFTYGATASLLPGTMGVMLQTGASTLASQVARHLAIHGDPVAAVRSLGTDANIRQLVVAMVSAGLIDKLIGPMPTQATETSTFTPLYSEFFKHELMKQCITTPMDVVILNNTLRDALKKAVKQVIVNPASSLLCQQIGQAYGAEKLDYALHKGAHAVVGFVSSAALDGNRNKHFGAGLGALMAEIAGDAIIDQEAKKEAARTITKEVIDKKIPKKDQKAYFYQRGKEIFAKEFIMAKVIGTTAGALFFKGDGAKGAQVASDRAIEHNSQAVLGLELFKYGIALGAGLLAKEGIEKGIKAINKAKQGESSVAAGSGGMQPDEDPEKHKPEPKNQQNNNIDWKKIDDVIKETEKSSTKNITSQHTLTQDEALEVGLKWVGKGYKDLGRGVFRSADNLRQFRIDSGSLLGNHNPYVPHIHLQRVAPNGKDFITNNHIKILKDLIQ